MMATRFVPNPTFQAEIQRTIPFDRGMTTVTVRTSESIRDAAQVFRKTGRYLRDIGPVPARLGAEHRIALPRHIWHIVELGSVNNPPQANVRRGVRAAGLRYEDTGPKQAD